MSGVAIEFSVENGGSGTQEEGEDAETETGEAPAPLLTATGTASRLQGHPSLFGPPEKVY